MEEIPKIQDGRQSKKRKLKTIEVDRLSTLPDAILVDILSLLSIKTAAATSALSRQWRTLWTKVTHLRLHSFSDFYGVKYFVFSTIIDRIFQQLTSPKIHSFHITLPPAEDYFRINYNSSIEKMVINMCLRNAVEIDLCKNFYRSFDCLLPSCLVNSSSLVVLKLYGKFGLKHHDTASVSLPRLKKLHMAVYDFNRVFMGALIKSCPTIEELKLYLRFKLKQFVDISAGLNLQQLIIIVRKLDKRCDLLIDAPKLQHVKLQFCDKLFPRFVQNPCGLLKECELEAINLNDCREQCKKVLTWVSYVKSLYLFGGEVLHGFSTFRDSLFYNLGRLDIRRIFSHELNNLTHFLQSCPNLEHLILSTTHVEAKDSGDFPHPSPAFLSKLKRVDIKFLTEHRNELRFLKYILESAISLEKLVVGGFEVDQTIQVKVKFYEDLLSYSKASSVCEIDFSGCDGLQGFKQGV